MAEERTNVVVVGGGIAGLALGFHLLRHDVAVRVLEASARPGGNIRSEPRDGYLCEWGPNGFLDNEPATLRLVDALGLGEALAPSSDLTRLRWIVRDGRLRLLPTRPPEFLKSDVLSAAGRLRVLMPDRLRAEWSHYLVYPPRSARHPGVVAFRAWVLEEAAQHSAATAAVYAPAAARRRRAR